MWVLEWLRLEPPGTGERRRAWLVVRGDEGRNQGFGKGSQQRPRFWFDFCMKLEMMLQQ